VYSEYDFRNTVFFIVLDLFKIGSRVWNSEYAEHSPLGHCVGKRCCEVTLSAARYVVSSQVLQNFLYT
jgi:hypothetical protein